MVLFWHVSGYIRAVRRSWMPLIAGDAGESGLVTCFAWGSTGEWPRVGKGQACGHAEHGPCTERKKKFAAGPACLA